MTTCERSSLLKDVIAYVDVWSSDKRANYSKPFVEQLHEMGAQVSKTFSKKVTHVIFNNGHPATWRNAKKSRVKLVSVLWVGKCYDEGVHVDEDSYPALNDDSNPMLKNKKHRCMLPKDFPERTPENDRRMKKKLDKMMKDLAPKEPLVTDVSPVIIDEENGIVYSPALKRSDYMARRLKDMKEKHENLSPTASQMFESSSPTGPKPFLGSSPSVPKFLYEQSDDDSSASVAELGYSPDKEEGRTRLGKGDCPEKTMRKDFENPWLSPCQEVPGKTSISPLKCPDFEDKEEEGRRRQKSRRTSVRKRLSEKEEHVSESPRQETTSTLSKNVSKERRQSQMKLASPVDKKHEQSPKKSRKGKQNIKVAKTLSDRTPSVCPDAEDSSAHISSRAFCSEASPPQKLKNKTPKRGRLSLPAHMAPLALPDQSRSAASTPADKDDNDGDVFEDFFSPAHHHKRPQWPLLQSLPKGKDIQVPFELDFAPKKRKGRRSESTSSGTSSGKKRKLEEDDSTKSSNTEPKSNPQQLIKESLPALDSPKTDFTLVAKRRRQSTLSFISAGAAPETRRRASTSARLVRITETDSAVEPQETSNTDERPHTLETQQATPPRKPQLDPPTPRNHASRGNECTVAAGTAECLSEGGENENKSLQKMVKTKAARTLVMTSMPTEKQHTVVQVVKALGGFVIADQVCESTTHVVSGEHRRTLNILLGIARGCWILSFEWILWCLEQRQWIPEEPYELSEQFPAAQICRLQRHLSAGEHQQDLFQDQPAMFVSQHSQPPTPSLVELIVLCGGTVCKSVRQAGICIGKYRGRRPEGSRILSEQWVLDSITHLKQLPYDKYNLE